MNMKGLENLADTREEGRERRIRVVLLAKGKGVQGEWESQFGVRIPETAWRFIAYRQAAHQTGVLFLFWHGSPGGDEFLPGGSSVACNKDEFVRRMKPFAGMEDSVNWWALLCRLAASLELPGDSEPGVMF
ncbi:hypothetical protein DEO72_LG8g2565 [Vigna unguiculata]|uniref:Uncharacterized protein n=1 Tax=Vigna unguiculata TaxID=3917 RepID=A0A4D6MWM5_VIGUN|nr:hypothetical protein DEO72_LG8g2565 [Vigna unguiculata]